MKNNSKNIEQVLQRLGCIVYDIKEEGHEFDEDSGYGYDGDKLEESDDMLKGISLLHSESDRDEYYSMDLESKYHKNMVTNKRLDIDKFNQQMELLNILFNKDFKIKSIKDIKKIYAIDFLKVLNKSENDIDKINILLEIL